MKTMIEKEKNICMFLIGDFNNFYGENTGDLLCLIVQAYSILCNDLKK